MLPHLFAGLRRVVLDELHALVTSKRGDLLSLGLARLLRLAPELTTVGLSATVAEPDDLCRYLVPQSAGQPRRADLVIAEDGAPPVVTMLDTSERLPWAGHTGPPCARRNLRSDQAQQDDAWCSSIPARRPRCCSRASGAVNDDNLADRAASRLARCRSAPQGRRRHGAGTIAGGGLHLLARSRHRLGRCRSRHPCRRAERRFAPAAAHRPRQPPARRTSRAVLVPANRFEVLECQAAIEAVADRAQDTPPARTGGLDVLAQHILGAACGEPFRRRRSVRRSHQRLALRRSGAHAISTPWSISSAPAAMR